MAMWRNLVMGALLALGGGAVAQKPSSMMPMSSPAAPVAIPAAPRALTGATPAVSKADVDAWLDGYMPFALHTSNIPGAVVVVVKDGQIMTARGFGYADVAKRSPVDPERTLFRPGSVSKLTTWTAVMQQVEQGKIDLDKDINAYLDFKIPPRDEQPVTMRQLMTHTGGFEESSKDVIFFDEKHQVPLGDFLKRSVPNRIFAPGTTPAYSNWGTALAGYIVQRTSGEELNAYFEHHIFAPLGMKNTSFRQPLPANISAQMSVGYKPNGKPNEGFEVVGPWPAGSEASSGTDMARFMIAHLQDGRGLMRPETARMMHASPLDRVNPMSILPPLNRMELGFFETNVNGREVIGHLGDLEAFHTSLHLFMKEGVGFYLSVNSPGKAGAAGTLRNQLFMDFADRYFPDISGRAPGVDAKTAAEHAAMMAGNWEASRRWQTNYFSAVNFLGQTKVAVGSHGELVIPSLLAPGGEPRQWVEIAPFMWRDKFGHDRLVAKVVDGKVVRWSMDFFSPFEVFDRVPAGRSAAWLKPALLASLGIILLTVIAWPTGWWNRRRFKAAHPLSGKSAGVSLAAKIMATATLLLFVGWGFVMKALSGGAAALDGSLDTLLWLLQIAGIVILFGAVLISGWNMWLAFTDGSRWTRKTWAVLLFLASLILLYFSYSFGLLALTVTY
jgi:CubicO group peptidase (beta-lactamase class C family)